MAQQKQRKQPILIDIKNIFTYCFQSIQRLQPNSKTNAIINFMYTKHNWDDPKSRTFSFIPQRRRLEPNFMNDTYQTTNQANTTPITKTTTSTWVSPLTQSLRSYNWDNANSGVFILTFQPISKNLYSTNFVHFIHHQFLHFIDPEKSVHSLMNIFVHFIHHYINPLPKIELNHFSYYFYTCWKIFEIWFSWMQNIHNITGLYLASLRYHSILIEAVNIVSLGAQKM